MEDRASCHAVKPKHAGPKRGGVTQDFVKGPGKGGLQEGPVRATQGGSERPKEDTKKEKERKKKDFPWEGLKGVQIGPSGPRKGPKGGLIAQRNKEERKELPTPPYLFACAFKIGNF
jgi:hypothetical protein